MKDFLKNIIKEICKEEQIMCTHISGGYVSKLEKSGKIRFISGSHIGNNSYMATLLADDKCAMYEVMKDSNIPVIEYMLVWDRDNEKNGQKINETIDGIKEYYYTHNRHIVLKPNRGYGGKMVYNIEAEEQIGPIFKELIKETDSIALNPYYDAKREYRIIVLNGKVRLRYAKIRGQGQWQFNLSKGGIAEIIESKKLEEELDKIALKAYNLINANFVSIDIFECDDGELKILEINGSVSMEKYVDQKADEYDKVKKIYKDAILSMFEN